MTARAPVRDAPTLWALAVRQSMGAEADGSASTPQLGGALWREVLPKAKEAEPELSF